MRNISVRAAKPEDKEGILAISRQIWEGEDYVPAVLEDWLNQGGLLVAESAGKILGFANTSELAPGELWLEGLRVHPEHQGKGIAKILARAQLTQALARRPKSIRLATVEENAPSIHIAKELGFQEIARFFYLEADVRKSERMPPLQKPKPEEAWDYLQRSPAFQAARGLLGLGWRFRSLTLELLCELQAKGALLSLGEPLRGLLVLVPDPYTPASIGVISFLDGEEEALPLFLQAAHAWAAQNGQRILAAMVAAPWTFTFLMKNGFQFAPEFGAVVVLEYARPQTLTRKAW